MAEVTLENVSKVYPDGTKAVDDLNLLVTDGEFLVLVGPSGCGKTTALRMVAGLEDISAGQVRIGGRIVNHVPSRDRDVAMVFQSYALYPHLDVFENMAFGMRMRKMPKKDIDTRVRSAADVLGLTEHLTRRPGALSGGQRQRVAMGRAMVRNPSAFLMDEPLSNLDAKLRVQMRAEIARTTRQMGTTTIYVTHDQTEAMTLGHRVAVMKKGVLQQVAPPQELYERPVNLFVAGFIGSPSMNLLLGTLRRGNDGGVTLHLGDQTLAIPPETMVDRPRLGGYYDRPIAIGIRPEDLADAALVTEEPGATLRARVDLTEALGSDLLAHARVDVPAVVTDDTKELDRDSGAADLAGGGVGASGGTVIVARLSPRSQVHEGDVLEVVVDLGRLHFFDPDDGRSIW
ncbi:MAG TPA: sn-glycerol-3-phosphate ABC transporter ATP-binding protein UgpC [Micromonosporaceae bacterium]|nr:sn-glycerol-3-phosphate ABC transporter ATP-binding protein UgpC [Micromonosporaceae bacterium]